jgi:hypothetical protein
LLLFCLAPPLGASRPKAAGDKAAGEKPPAKTYRIPYTLTKTSHIMVRVKVNGKGPFNLIVDTGAPGLYLATTAAKKAGLPVPKPEKKDKKDKQDKKGKKPLAVVLDRLDIEGGASLAKVKCLIETPFQLRGMNAFGLPGAELHGIMGYAVLAHFRMEIDFGRDTMTWTRLDFTPPPPVPVGMKGKDAGQAQLEALGDFMAAYAKFLSLKPAAPPLLRGFLGVELADEGKAVVVSAVPPQGPAARAGLRKGDRITRVENEKVKSSAEVRRRVARVTVGEPVWLTFERGGQVKEVIVTAGEGL